MHAYTQVGTVNSLVTRSRRWNYTILGPAQDCIMQMCPFQVGWMQSHLMCMRKHHHNTIDGLR